MDDVCISIIKAINTKKILKHMMTLTQKLPEFMAEMKQKYHPIIILDYQNAGEVAETQSKYGED